MVYPDGHRLAYWATNELRVVDIAPSAQPRTLLATAAKEDAGYIAWSSDSTGLVVAVNGRPVIPAGDAPPSYTKVRVVDVAGGQPRDVIRIPNANFVPLAWDRQARLIAGYRPSGAGAQAYDVVDEGGTLKSTNAGPGIYVVEASQDGQQVFGRGDPDSVVRLWPRGSYSGGVELRAAGDEKILWAAWRPGTAEIGVLFADRLELWNVSGARRAIPLPPHSSGKGFLVFRADGKSVFALGAEVIAVDIASGQTSVVDWSGPLPDLGRSVRIN